MMKKGIWLASLLILALACKKDNQDDTITYKWKRDLYRALLTQEGPSALASADPRLDNSIYVSTDFVLLTEAQKNRQQDSIFRASDRILAYKYEKIKN